MTADNSNETGATFRLPGADDGDAISALVRDIGTLAENSPSSYRMFCDAFADTCVVADIEGDLAGLLLAYRPPQRPNTLYVWQMGVHPAFAREEIGNGMLDALLDRPVCRSIAWIEAPVGLKDKLLLDAFDKLAEQLNAAIERDSRGPDGDSDRAEALLRLGPIDNGRPTGPNDMGIFEHMESEVRSYSRNFPTVFSRGTGAFMWDESAKRYIDFFAGAGVLNYGHNHPELKRRVMDYMAGDGILHGLDMATSAKAHLLDRLEEVILRPRGLDYKVQFSAPTGTNSVEAAFKLARKATGRQDIVAFTAGFHGMTLGSLAATANRFKRHAAGVPLDNTVRLPFDGYLGDNWDTTVLMERVLDDPGSGFDQPAAVIVETVQGEGGINPARFEWLNRVAEICEAHEVLLIVDDIQMGCGRTGPFFSFEPAEIVPDIVCLSKSIGGIGLPLALTLFRRDLDVWEPGEHDGTFRGNNSAFVAAAEALDVFWRDDALSAAVERKGAVVSERLAGFVERFPGLRLSSRGRGLVHGLECGVDGIAGQVVHAAFDRGLIIETSGARSQVLKVMPPLVIGEETLSAGLDIMEESLATVAAKPALP